MCRFKHGGRGWVNPNKAFKPGGKGADGAAAKQELKSTEQVQTQQSFVGFKCICRLGSCMRFCRCGGKSCLVPSSLAETAESAAAAPACIRALYQPC